MRKKLLSVLLAATAVFAVGASDIGNNPWPTSVYGSMVVDAFVPFEVTKGLVGWWKINEGSGIATTADSSGNGLDCDLTSILPGNWTTGPSGIGYALDLDGTNDEIDCGNNSAFDFTGDVPFSVAGCVNMDDANRFRIATVIGNDVNTREWALTTNNDNAIALFLYDPLNIVNVISDSAVTSYENTWTMFGATYDGNDADPGMVVYINGAAPAQTEGTAGGTYGGMTSTTSPMLIGSAGNAFGSPNADGEIAWVVLYDRELTADEMARLAEECR